ncbi:MAG: hypothetical protein ABIA37_05545, partial [Candidatus Woesearchaeota archaeon]
HGEDPDGIISAALLDLYLRNEKQYYFVSYAKQTADFSEAILRLDGGDIYITDLNTNKHLVSDEGGLLRNLIKKSSFLVWIDHHEGTRKCSDYLRSLGARVIVEDDLCASKLIYREFLAGDGRAQWLSEIAQAHDYGLPSPELELGEQLQKIIALHNHTRDYNNLRRLVEALSRDDSWQEQGKLSPDLEESVGRYQPLADKAEQAMRGREEFLEIAGRRIMITYADSIIYHKDTLRNLKKKYSGGADAYMVIFGYPACNVLFFRDNSSDFSPLKFCGLMGGGGREGDGGFSLFTGVNERNFGVAKSFILKRLEEYLLEK